jgi:hypothetical protein
MRRSVNGKKTAKVSYRETPRITRVPFVGVCYNAQGRTLRAPKPHTRACAEAQLRARAQ